MTNTLVVSDLEKSDTGLVSMRLKANEIDDELWFQLPHGFKPHSDQVAAAVGAVFGNRFEVIEFNEPLTTRAVEKLSSATKTQWKVPSICKGSPTSGDNIALSFSGGFDSLAALAVLGETANLVSIDFGGGFERERKFFSKFETAMVETNARKFESSWTFMGLGVILLREFYGADYFAFGSIFEASPWNFLSRSGRIRSHPVFDAAGLTAVNPIVGLSEFATADLAVRKYPEQIVDSLLSLASVKSEKFYRKMLMLELSKRRNGLTIDTGALPSPEWDSCLQIGTSFAADFLAPGMFKFLGSKAKNWMDAPQALVDNFTNLSLDFYWRDNTENVMDVPPRIAAKIASGKAELGVEAYRSRDWDELREVISFLKLFHSFPGRTF
ncbi:hypothetical protein HMPREF2604_08320 [Corynebacterium sp. HMSC055A01]|uniref:hypothetical protein n=1 Tax=Corynebacterium sp. HMSC055A01 TaxID=1715083 RepID=UPI0008A3EF6B|nr:hypothetical protein [Corynebacterium sp. HMSC055A01]OFN17707.1 hypothetical protein HMPREF2604_08320 [Corynebacterium sp. HMSC055A01]